MIRPCLTLLASLLLAACGGGSGSDSDSPSSCSTAAAESELRAALEATGSDADFSLAAQRGDGRVYRYERGSSTLQTSYESASTSKLVTAVIILRLVDQGVLKLSDRPQDRIAEWPLGSSDSLAAMTLEQLLSFTSGLNSEPSCLSTANGDMASCVVRIGSGNAGTNRKPGTQFFYASTHLQVAGLMAMRARGATSWQTLFDEFKSQTGLFANGRYDLPSASNPRLAGGMHWNGNEYLAFLQALRAGSLLNKATMDRMLADQTAGAVIVYSPLSEIGETWHYGLGLWHECRSASFNCTPGTRVSSPGAFGAYPFWDREQNYIGVVARQGRLGTYPEGIETERAIEPELEAWAACRSP